MKVLELPAARPIHPDVRPPSAAETPAPLYRLAAALTGAAAFGGVIELVLERVAGPTLTHAAGPSLAPAAAFVSRLGTVVVGTTAILVLLAAVAWAAVAWERHRVVAAAIIAATTISLAAAFSGDVAILTLLHLTVAVAAIGVVVAWRPPGLSGIALAAVAAAVVAGQWSLAGGTGTVAARVVAEAALVFALLLFAASVVGSAQRRRAMIGLTIGAIVAAAALLSDRTPLVALWASGATLWMPSVVYIAAGAAVGLLLACWLPDRATRHLAAGLVLLAVAGIEPTLVHHSVTALVALLALASPAPGRVR